VFLVVAVVTAVVIIYVIRSRPWRKDPAQMPAATQLSRDGRYWWDGTTWRPVPPTN
jgi:hypothetical protein